MKFIFGEEACRVAVCFVSWLGFDFIAHVFLLCMRKELLYKECAQKLFFLKKKHFCDAFFLKADYSKLLENLYKTRPLIGRPLNSNYGRILKLTFSLLDRK